MTFYQVTNIEVNDTASIQKYRHSDCDCEIVHYRNDDHNVLFSFGFSTFPYSDNGVSHAVEHCVLDKCFTYEGSNVFTNIRKNSVATILNATTYSDKTLFYAGSSSKKDIFNLAEVIANLIFQPTLHRDTFSRECWYIDQEYTKKGAVIYNEVRGYYSDHRIFSAKQAVQSVYKNTPLEFDAGGTPEGILTLTYEDVLDFHKRYYKPEYLKLFIYGDIDVTYFFSLLNDYIEIIPPSGEHLCLPPIQLSLSSTHKINIVNNTLQKHTGSSLIVNWALPQLLSINDYVFYQALTKYIFSSHLSIVRKRLINKIGVRNMLDGPGLDTDLKYPVLSLGFDGIDQSRHEEITGSAVDFLKDILGDTLNHEILESLCDQEFFLLRKQGVRRSLDIMNKAYLGWLNGAGAESLLVHNSAGSETELKVDEYHARIMENGIRHDIPNSVVTIRQSSKKEGKTCFFPTGVNVHNNTVSLKESVSGKKNKKVLPKLTLSDIEIFDQAETFRRCSFPGFDISWMEWNTGDTTNIDLFLPVSIESHEEAVLLKLLSCIWSENIINHDKNTGPFDFTCRAEAYTNDADETICGLSISLNAFTENFAGIFSALLYNIESDIIEDESAFLRVLQKETRTLQGDLMFNGMRFSLKRSLSKYSATCLIDEYMSGLSFLEWLTSESDAASYIGPLITFHDKLIRSTRLMLSGAGNTHNREMITSLCLKAPFLSGERKVEKSHIGIALTDVPIKEISILPSKVGYSCVCIPGPAYGTPDFGVLTVGAQLLTSDFMWVKIRKMLGAYSASAYAMGRERVFALSSHMDPDPMKSVEVFDSLLMAMKLPDFTLRDIEQGVLRIAANEYSQKTTTEMTHRDIRFMVMNIQKSEIMEYRKNFQYVNAETVKRVFEQLADGYKVRSISIICNDEMQNRYQKNDKGWIVKNWTNSFLTV